MRPRGLTEAEAFAWFMPGEPPSEGCWDWPASTCKGYGQFTMRIGGKLRNIKAHQAAYRIYYGPIPEGMDILHSCDKPICVQPLHLEADLHLINMRDASTRGLLQRGTDRWNSKLTEDDIRLIRASTLSQRKLAAQFEVSQSHISRIRTGNRPTWAWVQSHQ